jgi:hypothetical protein
VEVEVEVMPFSLLEEVEVEVEVEAEMLFSQLEEAAAEGEAVAAVNWEENVL